MTENSKPNRSAAAIQATIAHSQGVASHLRRKDAAKSTALILINLAALGTAAIPLSAHAQNLSQTTTVAADVQKLLTGYRTSKIVGSKVYNDDGEEIGTIDDLVISSEDVKTPYVVISVGDYVGGSPHLVAVPYGNMRLEHYKIVSTGATKEALKAMPEFKYLLN